MNMHQSLKGGASGAAPARAKCNPIRGRRPALQNCTIAELGIDPAYQRSIDNAPSRALIRRIAREWDWTLFQPLVVAQRSDAGLFVVDGQHRLAAARLRGDLYDLPCVITPYADAAEEAAAFVELNKRRKPLAPLELFKAALVGGDRDAVAVMHLLEAASLALAPHTNVDSWKPGVIANIAGVQAAYRKAGGDVTGRALRLVATAFPDQVLRYAGTLFAGIWPVLVDLGDAADDDLLAFVLGADAQADWMKAIGTRAAEDGVHRNEAARRAIRAAYDDAASDEGDVD